MGITNGGRETESLFKQIIDKNSPNLWKALNPQIQEANRTTNYLNPKRSCARHYSVKS